MLIWFQSDYAKSINEPYFCRPCRHALVMDCRWCCYASARIKSWWDLLRLPYNGRPLLLGLSFRRGWVGAILILDGRMDKSTRSSCRCSKWWLLRRRSTWRHCDPHLRRCTYACSAPSRLRCCSHIRWHCEHIRRAIADPIVLHFCDLAHRWNDLDRGANDHVCAISKIFWICCPWLQ